ncbi:IS200/IS605 family element transposase accessory protein TnpB [Candidatus Woesearchaeota archaeon]|nr:IS200/IS605 family element transposase accessory protein TnpB [Candidatus Woesearchaeota archaeon]
MSLLMYKFRLYPSDEKVGVDVGIENFVTLSNGEIASNSRHLVKSEKRLALLQRMLSRKKKGSKNRAKARFKLARLHDNIVNQRADFLHKLSHKLTRAYSFIAVEDLNVKGMTQDHCLAKHINDASWNTFVKMLSYKAVTCGGQLAKVNPRNTSKTCSKCGTVTEMPPSKRDFLCPNCGFACHRDLNASLNIQGRAGLARTPTPVEILPLQPNNRLQVESLKQEL